MPDVECSDVECSDVECPDVECPDAECQVWWARLSDARVWHLRLLDAAESQRRAGFRREQDRQRFTLGASLLRLAAGRWLGMAPVSIVVDRTCPTCGRPHGAPRLIGSPLCASISHSAERVVVALSAAPVGVDVEQVVDLDAGPLLETVLHPDERALVDDTCGFLRMWTRKEAVLKATGEGLRRSMADVRVSGPQQPAALLGISGSPEVTAELRDLDPGPTYVGALAVLGHGVGIRQLDATQLLTTEPDPDTLGR